MIENMDFTADGREPVTPDGLHRLAWEELSVRFAHAREQRTECDPAQSAGFPGFSDIREHLTQCTEHSDRASQDDMGHSNNDRAVNPDASVKRKHMRSLNTNEPGADAHMAISGDREFV